MYYVEYHNAVHLLSIHNGKIITKLINYCSMVHQLLAESVPYLQNCHHCSNRSTNYLVLYQHSYALIESLL